MEAVFVYPRPAAAVLGRAEPTDSRGPVSEAARTVPSCQAGSAGPVTSACRKRPHLCKQVAPGCLPALLGAGKPPVPLARVLWPWLESPAPPPAGMCPSSALSVGWAHCQAAGSRGRARWGVNLEPPRTAFHGRTQLGTRRAGQNVPSLLLPPRHGLGPSRWPQPGRFASSHPLQGSPPRSAGAAPAAVPASLHPSWPLFALRSCVQAPPWSIGNAEVGAPLLPGCSAQRPATPSPAAGPLRQA